MITAEREDGAEHARLGVVTERGLVWGFWLVPLGFYLLTVSRTPGWVDAPLIARTVDRVELSTWVNSHNLFTLVGGVWLRLTPRSVDPHYALNLLCSMLGALTVYVVFLIGRRLTNNDYASVLGAIVLMVSHSLWWHSTMLEVYTLSTVLLAVTLLFVLRYEQHRRLADLCGAAFAYGLGCSNHPQMALLGLGFLGLLLRPEMRRELLRAKDLVIVTTCFLMGFQVYLWVFLAELIVHLRSSPHAEPLVVLRAMLDWTSGGDFKQYMFPPGLPMRERLFWWAFYAGLFVYNFVPPWLLFAPVGAVAWLRNRDLRASAAFFFLALLAQLVWSANYLVWDMYAFSLPAYVLTAVLVIAGVDWVYRRGPRLRALVYALTPTVLLVPLLYAKAPTWIAESEPVIVQLQRIPQYEQAKAFWDPLDYFFNPNKRSYDRVERYAEAILSELAPHACYWGSEATMLYPLKYYYRDVLEERADVSYHLVFGILQSEAAFERHATRLREQLEQGCPVYVSSLGYPERNVLNRVYHQLDGTRPLSEIARLSERDFVETFPHYRLNAVDLDPAEGVRIYRLEARQIASRPQG